MKTIAVIPARLASTRLPRKMLRDVMGKPLIGVVYEAVRLSPLLSEGIIATDSEEIMSACRHHGWNARLTSSQHRTGSDRVHDISNTESADVYMTAQVDEPLVCAEQIDKLLAVSENPAVYVST